MLEAFTLQRSSTRCGSQLRSIWSSLYLLCLLLWPASATSLQPLRSSANIKDLVGNRAALLNQDSANTAQAWLSDRQEASRGEQIEAGVKQRRAKKRDRRMGLRIRLKTQEMDSGIDESRPGLSSNTLNMKAGKRPADDAPQSPDVLALTPAQVEMVRRPITIGLMTNHFFGSEYAHEMEDCNLEDVPLRCTYKDTSMRPDEEFKKLIEEADALWYHAPSSCMLSGGPWADHSNATISPFKHHAGQLAVVMSMESSAYYRCLDDPAFMQQFDVEMTYRKSADIPLFYWGQGYRHTWEAHPPLPQGKKKDAVAYINSNCGAPSGRNEIVQALMDQPGITVDSFGRCLNNQEERLAAGAGKKYDTFREYKYCIAIENSIAQDYVTEKVYDALAAGCVPIYLGAPNIADFVPSRDAIVDYNDFRSAEALAAELKRLSADEEAYEAKFAWRNDPDTWEPFFKQISDPEWARKGHPQCQLCKIVARRRAGLPDSTTAKLRLTEGRPKNSTQKYKPAGLVPYDKIKRVEFKLQNLQQPQTIEHVTRR